MKEIYQDDCLGQSTILCWHNFFWKGQESTALEPHSGRPTSIVTETNINAVAAFIRHDCYMLMRRLKSMVHISKSSIHRILSKHLQVRRICSTRVPYFLSCKQMERRVLAAKEWVQSIQRDRNFLSKVSCVTKRGSIIPTPKPSVKVRSGGHPPVQRPKKFTSRNRLVKSCYTCFLTIRMSFTNI